MDPSLRWGDGTAVGAVSVIELHHLPPDQLELAVSGGIGAAVAPLSQR